MFRRLGLQMHDKDSWIRTADKKRMVFVNGIRQHVDKRCESDHIETKGKVVFWCFHVVPFTEESLS